MKRHLWAWAALGLLGFGPLLGQTPEAELLNRLYSKLSRSFAPADLSNASRERLLLRNPGVALTQADLDDLTGLSTVLDQVPQVSSWYAPSLAMVSTTYGRVLAVAQPSSYQSMVDRDAYNKAILLLYDRTRPGVPTPKLAAWRASLKQVGLAQLAYQYALDDKATALAEAASSGQPVPPGLDGAIGKASQRLAALKKDMAEVDAAYATIKAYHQAKAGPWLKSLRDQFNADQQNNGFMPLEFSPPADQWLSEEGWKKFTYRQKDKPLPPVPFPTAGGAGDSPAPVGLAPQVVASMRLTLETKRVHLERPWLDGALFQNRAWRLPPGCGFTAVATGNLGDADPGLMPLVITGLLLSRNLVISGTYGEDNAQTGPTLTALGPFNLAAENTTVNQAQGALSIACPGPQIIGYFCEELPKTPDPDKNFR